MGHSKTVRRGGPIQWAPRLAPSVLRRLYSHDAKGIHVESLLDEVGITLLARCEDIRRVSEHRCWHCGGALAGEHKKGSRVACVDCGWSTSWTAYRQSYKGRRVNGSRALPAVKAFLQEYPHARGWPAKIMAIDRLIHSVHESFGHGQDPCVTPLATNLVEGSAEDTFALLESIAIGDRSTQGLSDIKRAWEDKLRQYEQYKAEKSRRADEVRKRKEHNKAIRERLKNRRNGAS